MSVPVVTSRHATRLNKVNLFRALTSEEREAVLYMTLLETQDYIVELEEKAAQMASPEAMQKMMGDFMGGGLFS